MAKTYIYRTYRWTDKDPILNAVAQVVKAQEHLKNSQVHAICGVATATLDNWFSGGTRRPQNSTVTAVTSALGYVRRDELRPDGTVVPGFVKANSKIDYEREMEKQADWLLKQHGAKKKRPRRKKKAKSNGNGH
jgi:DNA-binding transcriptional regulator YdaS (Cro superfamily)